MIHAEHPKFVFIHMEKCGGSSITKTLANYLGKSRDELRPQQYKFISSSQIPRLLGNQQREFYVFSFVRNPLNRVVSYFHYLKQIRKPPHRLSEMLSFEDWVRAGGYKGLRRYVDQLKPYSNIDFIGTLEFVDRDWQKVCDDMNLRDCELIHDKQSKHDFYMKYYNEDLVNTVYKYFSEDYGIYLQATNWIDGHAEWSK